MIQHEGLTCMDILLRSTLIECYTTRRLSVTVYYNLAVRAIAGIACEHNRGLFWESILQSVW